MRRRVFLVGLLVLAISLFSCGRSAPTTGILRVHNSSDRTINYIYVTPSDNLEDWGSDQLYGTLPPNYFFDVFGIPPGYYDASVVVDGIDSTYFAYFYSIPISAGYVSDIKALNSSFTGSIEIVNNHATSSITEVHIWDSASDGWWPNELTKNILPGASAQIIDLDPVDHDVWVVWANGSQAYYTWSSWSLTLSTHYIP